MLEHIWEVRKRSVTINQTAQITQRRSRGRGLGYCRIRGDKLPPPEERLRHGEATYLGPAEAEGGKAGGEGKVEDEGGKKKHRLSGLFHRKGKSEKDG